MNVNRFTPIILLVGVLFNLVCVIVFRLRLDRKQSEQFLDFKKSLEFSVNEFSRDALKSIDSYFASNYVSQSSIPSAPSTTESQSPVFLTVGDWDYVYCVVSGSPVAIVGTREYYEGDRFPRGGFITALHPDGIELDKKYWVSNRRYLNNSSLALATSNNNNLNGGFPNVGIANTSSK